MNILYCGDDYIEEGLLISILSLLNNVDEPLGIYILTMQLKTAEKVYQPVSDTAAAFLHEQVRSVHPASFVQKIDITELFLQELPLANMGTRFTPCCMLRLFADLVPQLPEKILYLDNDVVCRQDCGSFYQQDIADYELAGVLDHYGKWLFRRSLARLDYLNSGVLLLNLRKIRETGLFHNCRQLCREKTMFMPDQSAINALASAKKFLPRRYNEQRKLHKDTVFQHFTTSFRFFPWLRALTVKPWQVERVQQELKLHEYDELLAEYVRLRPYMR